MTDFTALTTVAQSIALDLNTTANSAAAAAIEAQADVNRLALAEALLDAEIPEGALVDLYDWADEPNTDGTYDMDISEAYMPIEDGGEVYGDLAGQGAIPAGHVDGGTDWDLFLVENTPERNRIEVTKVYAWLAAQPQGTTGQDN